MRSTNLRELLDKGGLVVPGVANALTARVVEQSGYQAVYVTGAGLANTHYALPDLGFVSLDLLCETVRAVRGAVDLSIIVDADTGFGNAVSTYRAVKMLEAAGADAIQLEDQVSPKRCGHFAGTMVVSAAEHGAKITAAREALTNSDTVIIARTDARAGLGLSEAIDRANLYLECGADVAFVEGPRSRDEIVQVARRVNGQQVINIVEGGVTPLHSISELRDLGFSMILFANLCLQASVRGVQQALDVLREGDSLAEVAPLLVPWAERQELARKPEYDLLEERFGRLADDLATDDAQNRPS